MLTKNQQKYIRSLALKKNRDAEGVFLAEGPKVVGDLLGSFPCRLLAATPEALAAHAEYTRFADSVVSCDAENLHHASLLQASRPVLAVFEKSRCNATEIPPPNPANELVLLLDEVQDPGNLGTIIRLADWFGLRHIICSLTCADAFAPKVVQSTMGSLARVAITYCDLTDYLQRLDKGVNVYGTFLDGNNIYEEELTRSGCVIMGNEGRGISKELARFVTKRLFLPNYPEGCPTGESLNVAIATAITCAEFRRRMR